MSRTLRTWGESESGLAERLADRIKALDATGNPTIAFLASGIEGLKVRLTAKGPDADACRVLLDAEEAEIRALLGGLVFGLDDETMEFAVLALLAERGLTLGIAESVTGGLIGARITDVPGASKVFRGGVTSYASEVKFDLLGVPEGPVVTAEAAQAMAAGARRVLGADVGLAVTGVAGPEPQDGRDPGTVFIGIDLGPLGDGPEATGDPAARRPPARPAVHGHHRARRAPPAPARHRARFRRHHALTGPTGALARRDSAGAPPVRGRLAATRRRRGARSARPAGERRRALDDAGPVARHAALPRLGRRRRRRGRSRGRGGGGAEPRSTPRLGPATTRLGRTILVAPVAGLDRLAASVIAATSDLGTPPEDRPFLGHVTLARAKRRLPSSVVGVPIDATWTVTELAVVASDTRPEGARYTDVARVRLGGAGRA